MRETQVSMQETRTVLSCCDLMATRIFSDRNTTWWQRQDIMRKSPRDRHHSVVTERSHVNASSDHGSVPNCST